MKQETEITDVIALGCVSTDTKGGNWIRLDTENSLSMAGGLADD